MTEKQPTIEQLLEQVAAQGKRLQELEQELADVRGGIPFHTHRCVHGHPWRCTSPYCDTIARACLEHGGGPRGQPPDYAIEAHYDRRV